MDKIVLKIGTLFFASSFLISCATPSAKPDVRLSTTGMTMELKEPAYRVSTIAVSHDGKFVASGNANGDVTVWDMQNMKVHWRAKSEVKSLLHRNLFSVRASAFTPDGKNLLTDSAEGGFLKVWDVETGKIKKTLKVEGFINSIDVSSDSKKAVSASGDGMVRLWDIETGADKNDDSKVSVVELGEYSKVKTIEISKTLGHTQTPMIINFGKDNPVYGLR